MSLKALALALAFRPLTPAFCCRSLAISWLEQKAVAVLLSLLSLGVKNVRIGPALPAFVTPATLDFLVKQFNLQHVKESAPDGDADAIMGWATGTIAKERAATTATMA